MPAIYPIDAVPVVCGENDILMATTYFKYKPKNPYSNR
jgi:hypothetical protein